MADRTITIRIVSDNDEKPQSDAHSSSVEKAEKPSSDATDKKNDRSASTKAAAAFVTMQTVSMAKSFAMVGYSRYSDLTEDYISQTASQNARARISEGASFVATQLAWTKLGAQFGPIGAVVGAAVGTTMAGLNTALRRAENIAEQARSLHEEAYSLYFNTARAGMVNHSRGTEN